MCATDAAADTTAKTIEAVRIVALRALRLMRTTGRNAAHEIPRSVRDRMSWLDAGNTRHAASRTDAPYHSTC